MTLNIAFSSPTMKISSAASRGSFHARLSLCFPWRQISSKPWQSLLPCLSLSSLPCRESVVGFLPEASCPLGALPLSNTNIIVSTLGPHRLVSGTLFSFRQDAYCHAVPYAVSRFLSLFLFSHMFAQLQCQVQQQSQ